jgi:TP901-1 family phage major tail protein
MAAAIEEYSSNLYCDISGKTQEAIAGKDILLCVFNADGSKLLAISGQQSLTINREKEMIEVNSKTLDGGWKSKVPGIKDWSIETDGVYSPTQETHQLLNDAFENDAYVCLKVVNIKAKKPMFGGLALLKEYNIEAPFDDSSTFEITLEGCGKLVDLSKAENAPALPASAGLGV